MDQDQRGQVGRERSPLSMEESREDRRIDSESTGEVPVRIELEIGSGSGSDSKEVDNKEVGNVGSLDNGGSSSPGLIKLERSKTERQRHNNIYAEEAAQIFDDKISDQQKVNFISAETVDQNGYCKR
ncbi:hypothetical protein F2P56_022300 [Juglans regia]|uniref:Uncharacterized protein n=1 Tax=Juglans regia TaxID=51240 RepID=A0A833X369_JUGRE|nr:hypothetical protein F2P56_022300 [Juglans regia]